MLEINHKAPTLILIKFGLVLLHFGAKKKKILGVYQEVV